MSYMKYLIISLLILFTSCVGVIKDNNANKAESDNRKSTASFLGIYDGKAISHSAIVVRFKPATNTKDDISYAAHLDSSPIPSATILGSKATIDQEGYINLTIRNLEFNTPYIVNIKAMEVSTERYTPPTESLTVWTMNTYVPEFTGIIKAENIGGISGMTSLKAIWNLATVAEISGDEAFNPEHAVSGYNVYYSTSKEELEDVLNLDNQHYPNISSFANTKIAAISGASTSEYTITGLTKNTTYYIAVRARQSSSPPIYERNIEILSKKTYSTQPVEFAGVATATVPNDVRGFNQVDLSWQTCIGCGLYKIFAKPQYLDSGSINPISDEQYLIQTINDVSTTSKSISDATKLSANQTYKIYIIACKDSNCGWNGSTFLPEEVQGRYISSSVKLTPPIAQFSESNPDDMITNIVQPAGTTGLEKLDISWSPLDTTSGYYTKVRIYRVIDPLGDVTNISGNPNLVLLENDTTLPFGTPYIDPSSGSLNSSSAPTSVRVANLQRDQEYCFQVLPWITGNGLSAEEEITLSYNQRPTVKCGTPQYIAPDFGTTSLAPNCTQQNNGTGILLQWTHPEVMNIFSEYEIYYRLSDGDFAFTGANGAWLNGLGTYKQMSLQPSVPYYENQLLITNLNPSTEYHFGVNTYYLPQGEIDPIREIPALNMATVTCSTSQATLDHMGWKHIMAIGPKIDGRDGSVVKESLAEDIRAPYPDPINGASNGIVWLKWIDYEITGTGLKLSDIDGNYNGYVVYRMLIQNDADATNALDPTYVKWGDPSFSTKLRFNVVSNANGKFAYSSESINADINNPFLIPNSNAFNIDDEITFELIDHPPTKGKIYYYLVKGVLNNVESSFDDPTVKDNVVKVVVPFDNEAFIHRWMANLTNCEDYGRGIGRTCTDNPDKCVDRENDYRCKFAGMGSTEIGGVQYIDRGMHIVVDRFELGCNVSWDACTTADGDNKPCFDTLPTNLVYSPGVDSPEVAYRTNSPMCYYRANAAGSWTVTASLPIGTINTGLGTGVGNFMFSTNAYLPPAGAITQSKQHAICQSFPGRQLYAGQPTIYKKLFSTRDYIIAAAWDEARILADDYHKFEDGQHWLAETDGTIGSATVKDCNNRNLANKSAPTAKNLVYTDTTYCNDGTSVCPFMTGTDGNYSSEHCVSRFGIQDLIGNMHEATSDQIDHTTMIGMSSTIDPSHTYMEKIHFDADTLYTFDTYIYNAPYFNAILGLMLSCSGSSYNSDPAALGTHQCQEDDFTLPSDIYSGSGDFVYGDFGVPAALRKIVHGGWWNQSQIVGRFHSLLYSAEASDNFVTSRCVYEIP